METLVDHPHIIMTATNTVALATQVTKLPKSSATTDPVAESDFIEIHNDFKAIISNYPQLHPPDSAGG